MNTKIEYFYRDSENNKNFMCEVLPGEITKDQMHRINQSMNANKEFLPEPVGLPTGFFEDFREDIDGPIHELFLISLTDLPVTLDVPVKTLVQQFEIYAGKWDEMAASGQFQPDSAPAKPAPKPVTCSIKQVLILNNALAKLIVFGTKGKSLCDMPWPWGHVSEHDILMMAIGVLLENGIATQCVEHFTGTVVMNDKTRRRYNDENVYFVKDYTCVANIPAVETAGVDQFTGSIQGVNLPTEDGHHA